ncbi:MAG: hypothetical protein HN392_05610 [Anaerolineae bacterium]|jgi:alanyl-tRNA synthetase|nr:hypothetical protein [Anaerolineae bacterium]MBT7074429.1 hypothetical protein [Anaerolineae bacterium]MBT7783427.1 hypothetical protein [Anaerolineae bacterium]
MTEKRYFDDPMTTEFTAEIVGTRRDERGFGVILPFTFFYPTGGGQSNDTGTIGVARVVDVFYDRDDIVHLLDREIELGKYPAKIDWDRRLANMQHHSGQHILSAVFWKTLNLETISSHISGDSPSTIDFEVNSLSDKEILHVEQKANQLIFENRIMRAYFVENKESVPFRRLPKVDGEIRVIEIEDYDFSACGGTHVLQTGMIGSLKIVRTERVNKKIRIHFVTGRQALASFEQFQYAAQNTANLLKVGVDEISVYVENLQMQLKDAQKELKTLREFSLDVEVENMVQHAEKVGEIWIVTKLFENRNPAELRALAMKSRNYPNIVALLASFDGEKLSLVTSCAEGISVSANDLLQKHLAPFNLRGGGDKSIAQGGGVADGVDEIFKSTVEIVQNS